MSCSNCGRGFLAPLPGFTKSYCPSCIEEWKEKADLYKEFLDNMFVMIAGHDLTKIEKDLIRKILKKNSLKGDE